MYMHLVLSKPEEPRTPLESHAKPEEPPLENHTEPEEDTSAVPEASDGGRTKPC
jgi:hypothetical protein